jgi:hypothetical protein
MCLRKITVCLRGHKCDLKDGYLEKSKLAQNAFEEGHKVEWDEAEILEKESNNRYKKYSVFHKSIRDLEAWPCSSKPTCKR